MERFEINKRDIVINRDDSIILLTKSLVERDEIAVPGAAILLKDVYYGRAKKINSCLPKMLVSVIDAPGVFEEVHCGDLEKLNFLYSDKYDLMDEEASIVNTITEPITNDDEEKLILPAGFNFVIPDEVEEGAAVVTPSEIEEATDAENAGEDIKEEVEETESQFATYAEEDIENELPSEDDDEEEVEVDQENPDTNEHTQPHHKHKRKKNKK